MKTVLTALSVALALALAFPAAAQSSNGNCAPPERFSFAFNIFTPNGCAGETVLVSEQFFVNTQSCTLADGSQRFRVNEHSNGTGVGVTTGTDYVVTDQLHAHELISEATPSGCPILTESEIIRQNLISKGSAPNQKFTLRITASIDANCNLTFDATPDTDCTGNQ